MNEAAELTGSKYEDIEAIARISSADNLLQSQFEVFYRESLENFYKVAGYIISEADLLKLRAERRPAFQTNIFNPIILQIAGNFKNSIPGIELLSKDLSQQSLGQLATKLNDYILYQANDISYELSKAFLNAIIGRIGWVKQGWSFDEDPEGMVDIKWYDPFRLKFDTNWNRRDTRDMKFIYDTGWYSPEEIINIYAKKDYSLAEEIEHKAEMIMGYSTALTKKKMLATWAERILNAVFDYSSEKKGYDSNALKYNKTGDYYNGGRFKVIDAYEKRETKLMKLVDSLTGQDVDITEQVKGNSGREWFDRDKLTMIREQYYMPSVFEERVEQVWQTTIIPGLNIKVYDKPQKWQNGNFKFTPILCYDFHPDILETKSIVDHIKDPINSYNLRRNTMLTYLMRMAHGGWLAEKGAIKETLDDFTSNEIGGIKRVEDGALTRGQVREIGTPQFPSALDRFAQEDLETVKLVSGSSDNARGTRENANESGYLYAQRVEQSNIMQEWISENAQSALMQVVKNNISIWQTHLKMEKAITITGNNTRPETIILNQQDMEQIINDVSLGEYEVTISKVPYGKTAKDREFHKIMELNQFLAQLNPAYVDPKIAIKLSNISFSDEMLARIEQVEGIQQQQALDQQALQQQQAAMQMQGDQLKMDNQALNNKQLAEEQLVNSVLKGMSK